MSKQKKMAQYAPMIIGGAALVIGLGLASLPNLTGGGKGTDVVPVTDGGELAVILDGALPTDAAAAVDLDEPPVAYVPDLTGEDIGELIVESDVQGSAHGLVVAGDMLVWLTTKTASLYRAPIGGGKPHRLFSSTIPDAFGGTLVSGESELYWSVERVDGEAELIFGMRKAEVGASQPAVRQVAQGGTPNHLTVRGDDLYWSEHGVIMSLPAGETNPRGKVDREQLIAGMSVTDIHLAWLEVPYEHAVQGGHAVTVLGLEDDEPQVVVPPVAQRQRELLLSRGERLFWVEGKTDGPWSLMHVGIGKGKARSLAPTGAVTALTAAGSTLYWAEQHGEDEQVVTLLRSIPDQGGKVTRLGRESGRVSALAVHAGYLYWSTTRGLKRLALD